MAGVLKRMGSSDPERVRQVMVRELGGDLQGPAHVTLVSAQGVQLIAIGPDARVRNGGRVAILAVRGQTSLQFYHVDELKAFWRDTIAVLDTLSLVLARIPGAKPGKVLMVEGEDADARAFPMVTVFDDDAIVPRFLVTPHHDDIQTGATHERRILLRSETAAFPDLAAHFVFLGADDRQRVVDLVTWLKGEMALTAEESLAHAEAIIQVRHGRPVRSDVARLLRAEGIMD